MSVCLRFPDGHVVTVPPVRAKLLRKSRIVQEAGAVCATTPSDTESSGSVELQLDACMPTESMFRSWFRMRDGPSVPTVAGSEIDSLVSWFLFFEYCGDLHDLEKAVCQSIGWELTLTSRLEGSVSTFLETLGRQSLLDSRPSEAQSLLDTPFGRCIASVNSSLALEQWHTILRDWSGTFRSNLVPRHGRLWRLVESCETTDEGYAYSDAESDAGSESDDGDSESASVYFVSDAQNARLWAVAKFVCRPNPTANDRQMLRLYWQRHPRTMERALNLYARLTVAHVYDNVFNHHYDNDFVVWVELLTLFAHLIGRQEPVLTTDARVAVTCFSKWVVVSLEKEVSAWSRELWSEHQPNESKASGFRWDLLATASRDEDVCRWILETHVAQYELAEYLVHACLACNISLLRAVHAVAKTHAGQSFRAWIPALRRMADFASKASTPMECFHVLRNEDEIVEFFKELDRLLTEDGFSRAERSEFPLFPEYSTTDHKLYPHAMSAVLRILQETALRPTTLACTALLWQYNARSRDDLRVLLDVASENPSLWIPPVWPTMTYEDDGEWVISDIRRSVALLAPETLAGECATAVHSSASSYASALQLCLQSQLVHGKEWSWTGSRYNCVVHRFTELYATIIPRDVEFVQERVLGLFQCMKTSVPDVRPTLQWDPDLSMVYSLGYMHPKTDWRPVFDLDVPDPARFSQAVSLFRMLLESPLPEDELLEYPGLGCISVLARVDREPGMREWFRQHPWAVEWKGKAVHKPISQADWDQLVSLFEECPLPDGARITRGSLRYSVSLHRQQPFRRKRRRNYCC